MNDWNRDFADVAQNADKMSVPATAMFFHQFLAIHPFLDGNGRFARELLSLQARELLGLQEYLNVDRGADYYAALKVADTGNFKPLEKLISLAIQEVKE